MPVGSMRMRQNWPMRPARKVNSNGFSVGPDRKGSSSSLNLTKIQVNGAAGGHQ